MGCGTNLGDVLKEAINEAVESAIGAADLSDAVKEELPDFDELVEKAVENLGIEDKVSDAVDSVMENYDFSDAVEGWVEKELDANLHEYVESAFETYSKTDKFKELIAAQVAGVLNAQAAAEKAAKRVKLMDYVKCGPLRRWVVALGNWY